MQPSIVAISASPSPRSRTALLAEYVLGLAADGHAARHYRISCLSPAVLLGGDMKDPLLAEMVAAVEGAHGLIVATPIYKASYSGLLKVFLDLLPQFALAGTAVLPIATGGSIAHVLALDYALRPVLQSMGARHIVQAHFVAEKQLSAANGTVTLEPEAEAPLHEAIHHLRYALTTDPDARYLGHPRPPVAAIAEPAR